VIALEVVASLALKSSCGYCDRFRSATMPIASWLAQGGKCRSCGAPVAGFHIAIELAALGVAASALLAGSDPIRLWAGCFLGWTLLALAWIDCEHMLLPDALTLPLVLAGLAATWLLDLTAMALIENPDLSNFTGFVHDSGEGRWTIMAAIEEGISANVLSAALYERFRSREEGSFADRLLSAMRKGFGGHVEPKGT